MGGEGHCLFDNSGIRKYLNSNERQCFHAAALEIVDPVRRTFVMTLFYAGEEIAEALDLSGTKIELEETEPEISRPCHVIYVTWKRQSFLLHGPR